MLELAAVLEYKLPYFIEKMGEFIEKEKGQEILKLVIKSIYDNIQYKLMNVMGDKQWEI